MNDQENKPALIDFPLQDEDINSALFTSIDPTEERMTKNNTQPYNSGSISDSKCIYSIEYDKGNQHIAIMIPIIRVEKKTYKYSSISSTTYTAKEDCERYKLIENPRTSWSYYVPTKNIYSKNLGQYIKEIIFEKCSIMRYKITIIGRFPNFGKDSNISWSWLNDYRKEITAYSLAELQKKLYIDDIKAEYNGLTKQTIIKIHEDFSAAGIKVSVVGANNFAELIAPSKKNKLDKLMTLKIKARTISYDRFRKVFICRIGKENVASSEFDDELCKSTIKEAAVNISFDNSYYNSIGFSYTLRLISYDAPQQLKRYYGGTGAEDGVTEFGCVEDENIFDIIRKFRELNIPTSLTGVKQLLNNYERIKKLADIINENFPEDVLLAQIGEEGIKF